MYPHTQIHSYLYLLLNFIITSYFVYRIHQEQEKSKLLEGTVSILRHQLTEKDEVLLCVVHIVTMYIGYHIGVSDAI